MSHLIATQKSQLGSCQAAANEQFNQNMEFTKTAMEHMAPPENPLGGPVEGGPGGEPPMPIDWGKDIYAGVVLDWRAKNKLDNSIRACSTQYPLAGLSN